MIRSGVQNARRSARYSQLESTHDNISLESLPRHRIQSLESTRTSSTETLSPSTETLSPNSKTLARRPGENTKGLPTSCTTSTSVSQKVLVKRSLVALAPREILLHTFALACSAVAIFLCAAEVYFKDADIKNINAMLNAFQFVAAVHAIVVGMSIGAIAVHHMLYELCIQEGLPLGYLTFPFQLSSVTIPFRTRFWMAALSKTGKLRKYVFGVAILAAVVLQALIGPSVAVLIVPQLDFWEYSHPFGATNGFTWFNQSYDVMWPSEVNGIDVPSECNSTDILMPNECPYANMAAVKRWGRDYRDQFSLSNITSTANSNQVRYVTASKYSNEVSGYSAASTIMDHIARDFGDVWQYAAKYQNRIPFGGFRRPRLALLPTPRGKPIMGPLVQTRCAPLRDITNLGDSNQQVTFPGDGIQGSPGQTFANITATINVTEFKDHPPVAKFVDISSQSGNAAVGVVVGLYFPPSQRDPTSGTGLFTCAIAAHWIQNKPSSDPTLGNVISTDHPFPKRLSHNDDIMNQSRPVNLTMSYLDRVNMIIPEKQMRVLEYDLYGLAGSLSNWSYAGSVRSQFHWIVATTISMQVTDALSRLQQPSRMKILCKGCSTDRRSEGKNIVQDLFAQNEDDSRQPTNCTSADIVHRTCEQTKTDQVVPVEWHVQRYGYSWSLNDFVKWLSLVPVMVHMGLTLVHFAVVTARRTRFEAWDSFPEFLGLANQSPALDVLRDLGVGIVRGHVYREDVAIRVLRDESAGGEGEEEARAVLTTGRDLERIEPGVAYT